MKNLVIRPAEVTDVGFLIAPWSKLCYSAPWAKGMEDTDITYAIMPKLDAIANRCFDQCYVAEFDGVLVGCVVVEANVIHTLYVKKAWRHNGIAAFMLDQLPVIEYCTDVRLKKFFPESVYNPFILFGE